MPLKVKLRNRFSLESVNMKQWILKGDAIVRAYKNGGREASISLNQYSRTAAGRLAARL